MSGIIAKNASRSSGIIGPVAGSGSTNNSVDTMTGDASDTTLSLSQTPGSENNVQITFDGVTQHHSTFSLSGSTITFSTAPAIGVLVEAVSGAASTTGTPDDGTVATAKIVNNAVDETKLKDALVGDFSDVTVTAADAFLYGDATDSGNTKKDTIQGILDLAGGGKILQVVNVTNSASSTSTTTMPYDDSIPQNSEGFEVMTLAITPADTGNKLIIQVQCTSMTLNSATATRTVALFQDSTANALAASTGHQSVSSGTYNMMLNHYMTAGTTSETTFKVRIGSHVAGTLEINGQSSARKFGGVAASSITIWEID
jgi:hypothetical protein